MKAVVVAGGLPHPRDVEQLTDADLLVAADAGACWLEEIGFTPDLLVGDLDSVGEALAERLAAAGVTIERHAPDKDASDAELALSRAVEAGADQVIVLGALGGERLDHELANLLLLADPAWCGAVRDLRIVRGGTTVRVLHGAERLALEGVPGDLVTLLPLRGDAEGVTTSGLAYALDDEPLRFGRSRGLSNVVKRPKASVRLESGTLLVIEIKRQGDGP